MAIIKSTAIGKGSGKVGSITYAYSKKKLIARNANSATPAAGWTGTQTEWRTLWGKIQAYVTILSPALSAQWLEPSQNYLRTQFVSDNFNLLLAATNEFITESAHHPTGSYEAIAWYCLSLQANAGSPVRIRRGAYRQIYTIQNDAGTYNLIASNVNASTSPAMILRITLFTYVTQATTPKVSHWYKDYAFQTLEGSSANEGSQWSHTITSDTTEWDTAVVIPITFDSKFKPSASFLLTVKK